MLSFIGFIMIISIVYLLLKGKTTPIVVFIGVPLVAALFAGFGSEEISGFVGAGLDKTWNMSVLFIFSVMYFGMMNDVGMFDVVVNKLIRWSGNNVIAVTVATAIIGIISHLDGATATTVLVTIPAMLPLYKRLNIRPHVLLLIVGVGMGVMNLVPWGGPTARVATVLQMDANDLWKILIPMQIAGLLITIATAVIFGIMEKKRGAGTINDEISIDLDANIGEEALALKRPKLTWFNLLLTAIMLGFLVADIVPSYLVFMVGFAIAATVNFPNYKDQEKRIKAHAPSALSMSATLLASGILVGVLNESGMLDAMTLTLLKFVPPFIGPYLHLVMAFISLPLGIMIGADSFYYGLFPLVAEVGATYGVQPLSMGVALLIGKNVGLLVSPLVPATFLAIGYAEIPLKEHLRFSFKYLWIISLVTVIAAIALGVIAI
ncbi:MAG: citrate:proton symporter [Erysipelotrichaceae bacterium]